MITIAVVINFESRAHLSGKHSLARIFRPDGEVRDAAKRPQRPI